jgi:hypothetical protein
MENAEKNHDDARCVEFIVVALSGAWAAAAERRRVRANRSGASSTTKGIAKL